MNDKVNPKHYQRNGIQCHDAIAGAVQNLTGADAYDTGAAIKYLWRWDEKHPDDKITDLEKTIWYIQAIIDRQRDLIEQGKAKEISDYHNALAECDE